MKKITTLLMLALMTTFGWQANAQNGGNTCAEALTVAPGTYSDAAIVTGTGGAAQADAADALWYSYTPAEDGLMSINSCASDPAGIDTRLYVYTDGCDTLTLVANQMMMVVMLQYFWIFTCRCSCSWTRILNPMG